MRRQLAGPLERIFKSPPDFNTLFCGSSQVIGRKNTEPSIALLVGRARTGALRFACTLPNTDSKTRKRTLFAMPAWAPRLWLLPLLLLGVSAGVRGGRSPSPPVKKVTWRATYQVAAPDCWERPVILVNGELSPKLEVTQGDILEVNGTSGWPSTPCKANASHRGATCGPRHGGTAHGGTTALAALPAAFAGPASRSPKLLPLCLPSLQLTLINDIPPNVPTVAGGISIHFHGLNMRGAPW